MHIMDANDGGIRRRQDNSFKVKSSHKELTSLSLMGKMTNR
jgi:hypothetical protein